MAEPVRTLIIGGGAIGMTTAYHLAREGHEVTLLDARDPGMGASEVNAGWYCPAEATPVPGPGMVAQSIKWMLRPDSPLYIAPSLQPSFVRFMVGMWRKCNARDQLAGFIAQMDLAADTAHLWDDYRADGIEFEMHSAGLLNTFLHAESLEVHSAYLDTIAAHGFDPQVLVGDDVRSHEPLLSDAVYGGIYFPHERHLDPGALMRSLHKRIVDLGVAVHTHTPVTAVQHDGGRVRAVLSAERKFEADSFVLATGAWTGTIARRFGADLPVRAGKGYSIEMRPFPLRGATNLSDNKVAVTPFADRLRLAGTMEFRGLDEDVNSVRVAAILRAPGTYFRDWVEPEATTAPRAGMRPMTPDGLPVIGRLGALRNTWVSSGHGMMGITLAPGTARALTTAITSGTVPVELAPFSPARFH